MSHSDPTHIDIQLAGFRKQIDTIDDQIIALLKQRTGIVRQVGALKRSSCNKDCFIRSAREALMHKDVFTRFSDGGMHPEAALAIWRHIITASTHMEKPMRIAAPATLHPLVDHYFGSYIPRDTWQEGAIPAIATVLCVPFPGNTRSALWHVILADAKPWRIFSYAPLVSNGDAPKALLLAAIDAEPSGDDISYFTGGTPPEGATMHGAGIWSVAGYMTEHAGAAFLGAHATPIIRHSKDSMSDPALSTLHGEGQQAGTGSHS